MQNSTWLTYYTLEILVSIVAIFSFTIIFMYYNARVPVCIKLYGMWGEHIIRFQSIEKP